MDNVSLGLPALQLEHLILVVKNTTHLAPPQSFMMRTHAPLALLSQTNTAKNVNPQQAFARMQSIYHSFWTLLTTGSLTVIEQLESTLMMWSP